MAKERQEPTLEQPYQENGELRTGAGACRQSSSFPPKEETQRRADALRRQRREGKDDQILRIVWKVGASPGGP